MNKHVRASLALLLLAGVLTLSSCAAFDQMASALANLQRLKFKLSGVRDFRLLGLDISGKTMLSEFNALDALRLVEAYRSMKLPVDFIVDVLAVNPNDGTGATRTCSSGPGRSAGRTGRQRASRSTPSRRSRPRPDLSPIRAG